MGQSQIQIWLPVSKYLGRHKRDQSVIGAFISSRTINIKLSQTWLSSFKRRLQVQYGNEEGIRRVIFNCLYLSMPPTFFGQGKPTCKKTIITSNIQDLAIVVITISIFVGNSMCQSKKAFSFLPIEPD